jgi:hypothetical protein
MHSTHTPELKRAVLALGTVVAIRQLRHHTDQAAGLDRDEINPMGFAGLPAARGMFALDGAAGALAVADEVAHDEDLRAQLALIGQPLARSPYLQADIHARRPPGAV